MPAVVTAGGGGVASWADGGGGVVETGVAVTVNVTGIRSMLVKLFGPESTI
jgi:hypothetical protein